MAQHHQERGPIGTIGTRLAAPVISRVNKGYIEPRQSMCDGLRYRKFQMSGARYSAARRASDHTPLARRCAFQEIGNGPSPGLWRRGRLLLERHLRRRIISKGKSGKFKTRRLVELGLKARRK
jgi:hypothetical protein